MSVRIKEAFDFFNQSPINYWMMSFKDQKLQESYREASYQSLAIRVKVYWIAVLILAALSPILLCKMATQLWMIVFISLGTMFLLVLGIQMMAQSCCTFMFEFLLPITVFARALIVFLLLERFRQPILSAGQCEQRMGFELVASLNSAWIFADILILRSNLLTVIPTLFSAKVIEGFIYSRTLADTTCWSEIGRTDQTLFCFIKIGECLPFLAAVYWLAHTDL